MSPHPASLLLGLIWSSSHELEWVNVVSKQSRAFAWVTRSLRDGCLTIAACGLVLTACSASSESERVARDDDDATEETGGEYGDEEETDAPPTSTRDAGRGTSDAGKRDASAEQPSVGDAGRSDGGRSDGGRSDAGRDDAGDPGPSDDAGPDEEDDAGAPDEPGDAGAEPTPGSGGASCLDGITDFSKAGPFTAERKTAGSVKMWVPKVPAGCRVPVVHLANGTGASCGTYGETLARLGSHGFLAVCFENPNTGAGTQGIQAIDAARSMYPDLVADKIGSTGHSQGGQGAFTVLALAEAKYGDKFTYAGLAMQPASGFGTQPSGGSWQSVYAKIKSPMFMFSGTADILVSASWVARGFDALNDGIEAYNWSAQGATHIPVPNRETMEVSVPWFRWKLLGDQKACAAFKALKSGGRWRQVKAQNEKACE